MTINNTLQPGFSTQPGLLRPPVSLANQTSTPAFAKTNAYGVTTGYTTGASLPTSATNITPLSTATNKVNPSPTASTPIASPAPPTNPSIQTPTTNTPIKGLVAPTPSPVPNSFPGATTALTAIGTQGNPELQQVNQQIADTNKNLANTIYGINTSGADLNFKQGEANQVQNKAIAIEQALETQRQNALTGQSQQINALGTVAGLVKPQVSSYGQTSFNPVTAEFGGGNSSLDPATVASDLAQKVTSGQMTYEQAVSSLGYAGSAGQQFLNNALKQINPSFNIPQSTTTIGTNADIVSKATSDISNMQTNLQAADTNLQQLDDLATKNGVNNLSSVTANKVANLFKGEFSNQALLSVNALLAGTRALYAAVLESRANLSPTDAYNAATQQVPDNINIGSLESLTQTLKTEAGNIISAKQGQIQSAQNGTTASGPVSQNNQNATQPAGWL